MLTEDQIEAMARANWPGIEWDDESLAESAHLREAFRAGARAVIAAHEAQAAPAVPQGEPVAYLWKYIGKDPYPAQIHGKTDGYIARSIKEMNPENPPYPDTWKPETPLYPPASLPSAPSQPVVSQGWKSVLIPTKWTIGPNLFKDWCNQWFGPDSDDEYLMRAAHALLGLAAAKSQPVTLTDDEMWSLWNSQGIDEMNQSEAIAFARVVIAALREKQAKATP